MGDSLCMQGLPLQDLLPGLLVVAVVDFDDVGHVFLGQVILLPAPATGTQTQHQTIRTDQEEVRTKV